MALTNEQIEELKAQLSTQVQQLPEDKKAQAQAQIDSMSPEAIEALVKEQQSSNSPYRLIINKQLEAAVIEDTSDALAVLEIQPKAKGHIILIPKEKATKVTDLPSSIAELAKKLSEKLKLKFNAKNIKNEPSMKFGELIIELIPEHENSEDNTPAKERVSLEELKKLAQEINAEIIKKPKLETLVQKEKEPAQREEPLKLKRRIA